MDRFTELREEFRSYGEFTLAFNSEPSVWACKFKFIGNKEETFHKTNLSDIVDELEVLLDKFKRNYIPRYVQ